MPLTIDQIKTQMYALAVGSIEGMSEEELQLWETAIADQELSYALNRSLREDPEDGATMLLMYGVVVGRRLTEAAIMEKAFEPDVATAEETRSRLHHLTARFPMDAVDLDARLLRARLQHAADLAAAEVRPVRGFRKLIKAIRGWWAQ